MLSILIISLFLPALLAAPAENHPQLVDEGRIVGGVDADIKDFPYGASLQTTSHSCGCAIIDKTHVLTAAHCVDWLTSRFIRAGSNLFNSGGQLIAVQSFKQHPLYSRQTLDYDAAVLTLAEPLEFNESVQPIKLARLHSAPQAGSDVVVSGWGSTREGGPVSLRLQKVGVSVVSREECRAAYAGIGWPVTDSMMCAGVPEGGQDACQGDSGGPLVTTDGFLAGLVSWGFGCARPGFPGVYGDVTHMYDWIMYETNRV